MHSILFELWCCDHPWTDKAHLTAQYIEQLRQLIEAESSKQSTKPGDPGIVRQLEIALVLRLESGIRFEKRICIPPHGAKLVCIKLARDSNNAPPINDGQAIVEIHQKADRDKYRRQQNNKDD